VALLLSPYLKLQAPTNDRLPGVDHRAFGDFDKPRSRHRVDRAGRVEGVGLGR